MRRAEDLLLEGHSVNIVGLPGSGRTATLLALEDALTNDPTMWSCLRWNAQHLRDRSDSELADELAKLRECPVVPVILIDDFGEFLLQARGKRLEQRLFAAVSDPDRSREALRCVLVTSPRDREIDVPGSGLRDRCKVLVPVPGHIAAEVRGRFGLGADDQLLSFCGGAHQLAPGRVADGPSERGIAMGLARDQAVTWVGHLRHEHHRRLSDILSRPADSPSGWRDDEIDAQLAPIVVRDDVGKCRVIDALRNAELSFLLVSEQWPSLYPTAAVRRFAARCCNEPRPRWIDNYLSDTSQFDLAKLADFLRKLVDALGDRTLEVLARDFVYPTRVDPSVLAADLRAAGIEPEYECRLDWRIYDQRATGNLHDRQLILPARTSAFKLPPATVVVGQAPAGNESDAELLIRDHTAVRNAWAVARPIW